MPGEIIVSTKTQNREFVNLVKDIPEDKQKEIGIMVPTNTQIDLDGRTEWADKRDRWYKLYSLFRKTKTNPWPKCSNICIPMMATAINQFHGRAYQSIFAAPDILQALPVARNDIRRAKNVEEYMNWQIGYEMEEYEGVMDKLLLNLPINGLAFKKLMYSGPLKRSESDYISALDLILPYKTKSLETARRITHRLRLHYDELLIRNAQGLYENFNQLNEEAGIEDTQEELTETAKTVSGATPPSQNEEPHTIFESHLMHDLGDGRKPYIFTVDKDTNTLLRAVSRDFKVGATTKTLDYFIDYHFIPNSEGFYSFGFGHFLEVLNEMANSAFNLIFDAGRLTNQPVGFFGRRAGFNKKKIKLHPGAMIEVDDASQVSFPTMPRLDAVLFNVLGLINEYAQNFTSVTENVLGSEPRGVERPTARGTRLRIEQGLTTFSVIVKRTYRSMRKEFKLLKLQNEIFLPDSKEYRISGNSRKIAFSDIKREDFGGVNDINPIADPSFASKQGRREEAIQLHEITMQNPLVIGTPSAGPDQPPAIKPNLRAIAASTKNLYAAFDEPNTRELIDAIESTIPPVPLDPHEENGMFMQGDGPAPQQADNHGAHVQIHLAFSRTPEYEKLPQEYKELFAVHMQMTKIFIQAQAAQSSAQPTQTPQNVTGGPPNA